MSDTACGSESTCILNHYIFFKSVFMIHAVVCSCTQQIRWVFNLPKLLHIFTYLSSVIYPFLKVISLFLNTPHKNACIGAEVLDRNMSIPGQITLQNLLVQYCRSTRVLMTPDEKDPRPSNSSQ